MMTQLADNLKQVIKRLIRIVCEEFSFSRVHIMDLGGVSAVNNDSVREITRDELRTSPFTDIAAQADEDFAGSILFGIWEGGSLAGFMAGFPANSYPEIALPQGLKSNEVLITSLWVATEMRGRNLGSIVVNSALHHLARRGYMRAYAVNWHNNWASIRIDQKAGMTLDHSIIVVRFRFWHRPLYWRFTFKGPRVRRFLISQSSRPVAPSPG